MPETYRKRKPSRASKPSNRFAWAVFGVLIGLFVAVIFYWQQTSSESRSHSQSNSSIKTAKTTGTRHPATTPKKPVAPAAPEFDFYTVLPKMQVTPSRSSQTAAAAPRHAPTLPAAASTPTAPAASSVAAPTTMTTTAAAATSPANQVAEPAESASVSLAPSPPQRSPFEKKTVVPKENEPSGYLLQMASLKNYADADRLKAQLTMLGFDVYIISYKGNGQIYNRVVMGPYPSRNSAAQQQARLQKSHVPSILIKAPNN